MTNPKRLIFLLWYLIWTPNVLSQSLENFNDVLNSQIIGKVITKKVGQDISQRTFLGIIRDKKSNIKYYVVKEFLRIQAATVFHGHSRILFFNESKKLTEQAILSLPNELPFKLKDNFLYFNYLENGVTKIFEDKVHPLPKMICVAPRSCYDVENP